MCIMFNFEHLSTNLRQQEQFFCCFMSVVVNVFMSQSEWYANASKSFRSAVIFSRGTFVRHKQMEHRRRAQTLSNGCVKVVKRKQHVKTRNLICFQKHVHGSQVDTITRSRNIWKWHETVAKKKYLKVWKDGSFSDVTPGKASENVVLVTTMWMGGGWMQ